MIGCKFRESVDTFTLIYMNVLEHQPDCPPEEDEKLVGLQEGIPGKDAREAIATLEMGSMILLWGWERK
ncbi:hypothetical protein D5086_003444 [Populus alba]|uniref:Uncharacterized protein n=1 Tax=Populus alba TaxID=43335 RepID=A0ACC4D562_POPAL